MHITLLQQYIYETLPKFPQRFHKVTCLCGVRTGREASNFFLLFRRRETQDMLKYERCATCTSYQKQDVFCALLAPRQCRIWYMATRAKDMGHQWKSPLASLYFCRHNRTYHLTEFRSDLSYICLTEQWKTFQLNKDYVTMYLRSVHWHSLEHHLVHGATSIVTSM